MQLFDEVIIINDTKFFKKGERGHVVKVVDANNAKQNKYFFTSKYFNHLKGNVCHDKSFNDVEELIAIFNVDECFNILRNNDKIKEILK